MHVFLVENIFRPKELSVKCRVGEISVGQTSVGQTSVHEIFLSDMLNEAIYGNCCQIKKRSAASRHNVF